MSLILAMNYMPNDSKVFLVSNDNFYFLGTRRLCWITTGGLYTTHGNSCPRSVTINSYCSNNWHEKGEVKWLKKVYTVYRYQYSKSKPLSLSLSTPTLSLISPYICKKFWYFYADSAASIAGLYGAIERVLSALEKHISNPELCSTACHALWSLAVNGLL